MNTFQLACFDAVSQTLNFARAAEKLNITQPAVTHQIHSLETELGVKLFLRTTRSVEMTTEGFLFLNDARQMLAISRRAKARLKDPERQKEQVFSIGCCSHTSMYLLSNILCVMKAEYPNVYPRLQIIPDAMSRIFLDEEKIDVLLSFQGNVGPKFCGNYKELGKVPIVCICPKGHRLAGQKSVALSELEQEVLLMKRPFNGPFNDSELHSLLLNEPTASRFHICDTPEAAAILVKAGYGIAIQAWLLIPKEPGFVYIPIEGLSPLSFGVYYKTSKDKPLLRRFMELCDDHFRNLSTFSSNSST